jgi:hypothetical protein
MAFKISGPSLGLESETGFDFPRNEFRGVRNVALVVLLKARPQVSREAGVVLFGMAEGA